MKIKKFNNLWTMGLIIFIGILVGIYLIKLINPGFVVGVAETESVVRLGQYIDSHKWAYYLATALICFIAGYFYCGACCKKKILNWKDLIVLTLYVVASLLVQLFIPQYFSVIDVCLMIGMPMIINAMDKNVDASKIYSFGITFIIHNLSQIISLQIRDIGLMIAQYNFASYLILLIDGYIWLFILYFYFNFKKEN